MLTAGEREQRARSAAYRRASQYDGNAVTSAARAAADRRFITQVAAEAAARGESISEQELQRRALALRKFFYAQMAFKSARARARNRAELVSAWSTGEPAGKPTP